MKGLCHDCVVEVDNSLACRGTCEANVRIINEMQNNAPALQKYGKAMKFIGPMFIIVYGLYLIANWSGIFLQQKDIGLAGLGVISAFFGGWLLLKSASKNEQ
jgi:hypothetical protein